ncbi:MAG: putative kinase [Methanophagales archaeon]|nr:aminoglycoside phosphotransferase family protein [Methanophagales archaeon]MCU4139835.1 putative kinase [Methanophagales archaeon]
MKERIEAYLESKFGVPVRILSVSELGLKAEAEAAKEASEKTEEIKGFGYGKPLLVSFECVKPADAGGGGEGVKQRKEVVISTMKADAFGHQHFSDRARILLWQFHAFNSLPKHVRALDVGYFSKDGSLRSVSDAEEFFLVCEKVEGVEYARDLKELLSGRALRKEDEEKAVALASYLAEIHALKKDAPDLYIRKLRELVGDSECIFGLADSYPSDFFISSDELKEIEKKCVDWRWKLKSKVGRLSRVHGDFHPWNVIFSGKDFVVLDRSRGEWGEPADDVVAMAINYIFFSLLKYGSLAAEFKRLFEAFFETYLRETGDEEILEVVQPFFAFRGLVIASPIWYPQISAETRRKIFNFIENVLNEDVFDYKNVNDYLK